MLFTHLLTYHCDLNHSIFVSFVIVFILDWTPCHPSPSPPLPSSLFQLDPRPAAAASCDPCLATNPTTNPSSPPPFPPDRQAASPPLPLLPQPAGSFPTLAPRPRCTRPAAPTGAQLFFFRLHNERKRDDGIDDEKVLTKIFTYNLL